MTDGARSPTPIAPAGRRICRHPAVLMLLMAVTGPAAAQPNTPPDFDPHALELDPVPLVVEAFGLALHPPAGAAVSAERIGSQLTWSIVDTAPTPAWSMRIQSMTSNLPDPSAASQIQEYLRRRTLAGVAFRVLDNEPVTYGQTPGQLCFLEQTSPSGETFVAGWLVLPRGRRTFVVFSIRTAPEHLPRLRPMLDASFSTISLRSDQEITRLREQRLEAGRRFLESVTPERLKSLVGRSQWFRIYRPNPVGGEQELGYSFIEVIAAKRGSLNPQRSEDQYDAGQHEVGLTVRIHGRIVIDATQASYYDSLAVYWMAWDQSQEAWSIRTTQRQGDKERSESETGVRPPAGPGQPRPKLTVIKSVGATYRRDPYEWVIPDVYLSQPLAWLLGDLLPKDGREPLEFTHYAYNFTNAQPKVSLRNDRWAPNDDGSGTWVLRSQLSRDSAAIRAVYGPDGRLIRREHSEGTITEPITLPQLRRLWTRKGLNVP